MLLLLLLLLLQTWRDTKQHLRPQARLESCTSLSTMGLDPLMAAAICVSGGLATVGAAIGGSILWAQRDRSNTATADLHLGRKEDQLVKAINKLEHRLARLESRYKHLYPFNAHSFCLAASLYTASLVMCCVLKAQPHL